MDKTHQATVMYWEHESITRAKLAVMDTEGQLVTSIT